MLHQLEVLTLAELEERRRLREGGDLVALLGAAVRGMFGLVTRPIARAIRDGHSARWLRADMATRMGIVLPGDSITSTAPGAAGRG